MGARTVITAVATLTIGIASAGHFAHAATLKPEPDGKALYDENCKKCHGAIGTPPKAMKAKFPKIEVFDPAFFAHRTDDSVVVILTKGKGQDMKSFKDKLSHEQMEAVAKYIVHNFGKK